MSHYVVRFNMGLQNISKFYPLLQISPTHVKTHNTVYEFHELFLNSPSIHQYCIFTCDKSTNVHRMVPVNQFTSDKSTNVYRMVPVNYFTCDKSTNVYRMVTVYYFTCDKSVQQVKKCASEISSSVLWKRMFLKYRILSMSSVSFTCRGDGVLPHPQVGAGIPIKRFLISLYSKEKSNSVETTAT